MFLDKSGVFKNVNLPTGNEWYFNILDLILPLTVFRSGCLEKAKDDGSGNGTCFAVNVC